MTKMDDEIHGNVDIALLAKELLKFEDIKKEIENEDKQKLTELLAEGRKIKEELGE